MAEKNLKEKLCESCNEQFSEEPCEPAECSLLAAIEDTVEVVRCKDCKFYETTYQTDDGAQNGICYFLTGEHSDEEYCSKGERKTDHGKQ